MVIKVKIKQTNNTEWKTSKQTRWFNFK